MFSGIVFKPGLEYQYANQRDFIIVEGVTLVLHWIYQELLWSCPSKIFERVAQEFPKDCQLIGHRTTLEWEMMIRSEYLHKIVIAMGPFMDQLVLLKIKQLITGLCFVISWASQATCDIYSPHRQARSFKWRCPIAQPWLHSKIDVANIVFLISFGKMISFMSVAWWIEHQKYRTLLVKPVVATLFCMRWYWQCQDDHMMSNW